MGDSNMHNHKRCPLFLAGHANGKLKGNLHLKAPDGTPMANVMLSMLHGLGLDDMESFGDSTGALDLNSVTAPRQHETTWLDDTQLMADWLRIRLHGKCLTADADVAESTAQ